MLVGKVQIGFVLVRVSDDRRVSDEIPHGRQDRREPRGLVGAVANYELVTALRGLGWSDSNFDVQRENSSL
jgi:hypothetical protein